MMSRSSRYPASAKTKARALERSSNLASNLNTFMRHFGLGALLTGKDKPSFTKKKVLAYNEHVLMKMFEHATQDEADLLCFFMCTGAREGDASAVYWSDVDLTQKLYKVTEHLEIRYRPKDKEEEPLPIPDLLVERFSLDSPCSCCATATTGAGERPSSTSSNSRSFFRN